MHIRRRRLSLAVAAALLAAAGAVPLVRLAVDRGVLRAAAETRVSAMLGQPVTIGHLSISLLPTPTLIGSDIRVGPATGHAPALDLGLIRIVPRLRTIFGSPIVVSEVTLERLTVAIVRDAMGQWHFPAGVPAPAAGESRGIVIERVRLRDGRVRVFQRPARDGVREMSSIDDVNGAVIADDDGVRVSPIRGRVGRAEISGDAAMDPKAARVDFSSEEIGDADVSALLGLVAAERPAFLRLTRPASASVSVRIDRTASRLSATGSLRAPQVLVGPMQVQRVETPFKTDGLRLTFAPTTFTVYRGTHGGAIAFDLSTTPASWSADSRLAGLNFGEFLAALTGRDQQIDGTAAIAAALRGRVGLPLDRTVRGRADVTVTDGVIRQFALLAAINRALRLAEGDARDTRFERLTATLAVGDGQATTEDLMLEAREVRVEASGRIGFDRSLDLAGRAVLSPARTASAIRSVRELSGLRNDRGELEVPLTITGTADHPSFGLDLKAAIGKAIKDELRRRLRGIIRRPPGR